MRIPYWTLLAVCFTGGTLAAAPPTPPTYWRDVRPILRKNCTVCHSTKNVRELDVSGGLALDSYEAVIHNPKRRVLRPGKSADSLMIRLVMTSDDSRRMPLGALPVPPEQIAVLRRWIDAGAPEGKRPAETPVTAVASAHRRVRKLDVVLPTSAVPPPKLLGPGSPGRLELDLPVGPLAPVTAVAFSPDGKLLATGSYRQATVWDLKSGRALHVWTNVLGAVNDVRFSPDGTLLAVAGGQPSAKGDLRLYRVADGKLVATLGGHQDVVFGVAFHPDGKHLASASFDKTVRLWSLATYKLERTCTQHSDFVYAVAFGPGGKWLASCGKDRAVKVIDPATGKGLRTFSGMDQDVLALAVSPDGRSVVSSGFESALHWWNAQTGERVRLQYGHGVAVHELCFSPDGKTVASAGGDSTVRLWDGHNGGLLRTIYVNSVAYAVALSPDGKVVASGTFDGLARLWDAHTGRPLVTLLTLPAQGDRADWLAVTPEGYTSSSPGLGSVGRWRMGGQPATAAAVWKALGRSDAVARAMRGETLQAPSWK